MCCLVCVIVFLDNREPEDPLFTDGKCLVNSRYRTRPIQCYDYDARVSNKPPGQALMVMGACMKL